MNRRALGERLKALRQNKGLAQEALARALRVSRNTVNRWEMGERSPSLTVIERVAAALGVTVEAVLPDLTADRGRGPLPVPARIVTFNPAVLARQAGAGPLLSLMAIVNDIRSLRGLLIISQERLHNSPTAAEQAIAVGESGYFFRSLCALLSEGRDALDQVERKVPGFLDAAMRGHPDGEHALRALRAGFAAERSAGHKGFLNDVRNWVASHYDPQQLKSQLVRGVNAKRLAGELVLTPHAGLGRYGIIDEIATHLMRKALHAPAEFHKFQKRFYQKKGDVIGLAEALAVVVDHALDHLVERNVEKEEQSAIRVDPLIARARRKVEAERKKARAR